MMKTIRVVTFVNFVIPQVVDPLHILVNLIFTPWKFVQHTVVDANYRHQFNSHAMGKTTRED